MSTLFMWSRFKLDMELTTIAFFGLAGNSNACMAWTALSHDNPPTTEMHVTRVAADMSAF